MNVKTIISIVIRDIKQVIRSPAQLSLVIIFPLAITGFFAFMFTGTTSGSLASSYTIGILNNDQIEATWQAGFSNASLPDNIFQHGFGEYFAQSLHEETTINISSVVFEVVYYDTEVDLKQAIQKKDVAIGVKIPQNFSLSILTRINIKHYIENGFYLVNETNFLRTNSSITIMGDENSQTFQNAQIELSDALQSYLDNFASTSVGAGRLKVKNSNITSTEFTAFDGFFPGFIVFGVLLGSSSVAHVVGSEKAHRTLERVQISSISSVEYLLGISISQILLLTGQTVVMLLSAYFFGFNGKGNPLYALVVSFITIIPTIGLGLYIAAVDKTGDNASAIAAILSSPLGFMSGAFIPLPEIPLVADLIPQPGGKRDLMLWDLFPYKSSVSALRKILTFQYSLIDVIGELVLLGIGGIIIFGIGIYIFSKRVYINNE